MKTVRTSESVKEFIKAIESERLRRDAETLHKLFRRVTKKRHIYGAPASLGTGNTPISAKVASNLSF